MGVVKIAEVYVGSWPKYSSVGGWCWEDWGGVQPKDRAYSGGAKEGKPEQSRSDHGRAVMKSVSEKGRARIR